MCNFDQVLHNMYEAYDENNVNIAAHFCAGKNKST